MLITAKLTKLSCFINTVLQPCLIYINFSSYVAYDRQTVRKSLAGCKGAYDAFMLTTFLSEPLTLNWRHTK